MDVSEAPIGVQGMAYRYDQLNRVMQARSFTSSTVAGSNSFVSATAATVYNEDFHYDYNGNITKANRNGNLTGTPEMDHMTYYYYDGGGQTDYNTGMPVSTAATNKLAYVADGLSTNGDLDTRYTTDIDDQSAHVTNYKYDAIGNLTGDQSQDMDGAVGKITWNVYGKIRSVTRNTASLLDDLEFKYDASGNRVLKIRKPKDKVTGALLDETHWTYTYYVRDAKGNILATYTRNIEPRLSAFIDNYKLSELDIYGSSRLGILDNSNEEISIPVAALTGTPGSPYFNETSRTQPTYTAACTSNCMYGTSRTLGYKMYELSNQLGNVIATVSDRKIQKDVYTFTVYSGGGYIFDPGFNNYIYTAGASTHTRVAGTDGRVDYYLPDVLSSTDYYAFGAPMPGRGVVGSTPYRYNFNGKESDPEAVSTGGGTQDYGMRIYNPSLGKFLSVDPLTKKYPELTPYQFASNTPIQAIDLDGLERWDINSSTSSSSGGTNTTTMFSGSVYGPWANEQAATSAATSGATPIYGYNSLSTTSKVFFESSYTHTWETVSYSYPEYTVGGTNFGGVRTGYYSSRYSAPLASGACYSTGVLDPFVGGAAEFIADGLQGAGMGKNSSEYTAGGITFAAFLILGTKPAGVKGGLEAATNAELVSQAAIRAESAVGGTGRFAGTAKHTYATTFLEKYQGIYGSRGLNVNEYFNGQFGRGFLDVHDVTNGIIYDFKFGKPFMKASQFNKYSNTFGQPINIVDRFGNIIPR